MKIILYLLFFVAYAGFQLYKKSAKNTQKKAADIGEAVEAERSAKPLREEAREASGLEEYIRANFSEFLDNTSEQEQEPTTYSGIEQGYENIEAAEPESPGVEENYAYVEAAEVNTSGVEENYREVEENPRSLHDRLKEKKQALREHTIHDEEDAILEDFDLEKAIIYDAILHRPYS